MTKLQRAPLPAGAIIEFSGEQGEVVYDPGDDGRITVIVDGHQARWWWTYEGESCSVISVPD
ncbi:MULTISPECIES: hypothetical protein [Halomonadaceae]|uniref:hypothetical protein n=1 Tax=Halomonadaceae TaxID=28256 RepID=UPI003CEBC342